ncbi:hypothetical protein HDU89_000151 [Geranomyces variabilis]|nr:hypothetical protein HDU89_000151 [Geranomyces variabilis]
MRYIVEHKAAENTYDMYGEAVPTELTDHVIAAVRQRVEFQRLLQDAANRAANAGLADNQIEREAAAARQRRSNEATIRAVTPLPENESQPSSTEVSPCSSAKRRASAPEVLESAKRARTASTPQPQAKPAATAKCPYTGDAERWWHEYLAGVAELKKDTDPRVAQVGRHLKAHAEWYLADAAQADVHIHHGEVTYVAESDRIQDAVVVISADRMTYLQSDPALREAAAALAAFVDDEGISLATNLSSIQTCLSNSNVFAASISNPVVIASINN